MSPGIFLFLALIHLSIDWIGLIKHCAHQYGDEDEISWVSFKTSKILIISRIIKNKRKKRRHSSLTAYFARFRTKYKTIDTSMIKSRKRTNSTSQSERVTVIWQ